MISAKTKLILAADEKRQLLDLLAAVNHLRTTIALFAFETGVFNKFALQNLLYHDLRPAYPQLASNHIIRALASVASAYKTARSQRKAKRALAFHEYAAIELDKDLWRFAGERVSISVAKGSRLTCDWRCGDHQREQLRYATRSAKLVYRRGEFYLQVACDVPQAEPFEPTGYLGVDLGISQLAVDSDSESHNAAIERRRRQISDHRARLQRRGTKSAKRRLKHIAGKQARFQKDVNHQISKRLVEKAKDTQRGIALEDLTGIRARTEKRLRKSQRARHSNWAFFQLRSFIEYKAALHGVPCVAVDPHYTSQRCSQCGHTSKSNRRSQSEFRCVVCGFACNADYNAAVNISRAAVNPPIVATAPIPA